MASGSDLTKGIGLEKNQYEGAVPTSSYKLVVFSDTHQNCVTQAPHQVDHVLEDPVEQHQTQNVEQLFEQHQTQDVEQPVEQQPKGVDVTLRRSTRIKKPVIPSDYHVYSQESQYDFGVENDPESFLQAINSCDSKLWYDAMKDELESMVNNKVWDLVEFPNGIKPIGCKWVFKTKKDSLGNIERHKARLVAKGFAQREGVGYRETFSPVSMKDSLGIIMALVAHFDLELHQMDVKMTFLCWIKWPRNN